MEIIRKNFDGENFEDALCEGEEGVCEIETGVKPERIKELDEAYFKLRNLVQTSKLGKLAFDKALDVIVSETDILQKKDNAIRAYSNDGA